MVEKLKPKENKENDVFPTIICTAFTSSRIFQRRKHQKKF